MASAAQSSSTNTSVAQEETQVPSLPERYKSLYSQQESVAHGGAVLAISDLFAGNAIKVTAHWNRLKMETMRESLTELYSIRPGDLPK